MIYQKRIFFVKCLVIVGHVFTILFKELRRSNDKFREKHFYSIQIYTKKKNV